MEIVIHTDGGALNNPGEAAVSYLIHLDGKLLASFASKIGRATNNTAEYKALILALQKVKKLSDSINWSRVQKITAISDSELMVRQLNGVYKAKHPEMKKYVEVVASLKDTLPVPVVHVHVLREENGDADDLVKKALGR